MDAPERCWTCGGDLFWKDRRYLHHSNRLKWICGVCHYPGFPAEFVIWSNEEKPVPLRLMAGSSDGSATEGPSVEEPVELTLI